MLAYRMFFRNVPRRIIYRSLASDGSGSKKPPSIAKSENKITNLKDKISLFLRPRKADSSKTPESSAEAPKSLKIAPNTTGLPQAPQNAPNTTSGSVPNSSNTPYISSSSFTKPTTAPKKEDSKAPNQPTGNTLKPDLMKMPSKPPKTKPVPKSDDIGLKSTSMFPTKCDDRKAAASQTENVKLTGSGSIKDPKSKDKQETCPPKEPPNPEKNCPDAKPKCGTQDPPKPCRTEYERTPCKSNTRESCPPPPCPPEPCKTKDASPRCTPKEPPKASKTEDTTCPPKEPCKTDHTRTPCKSNTRESCPPPPDIPPCKPEDTKPQCPPKHQKPRKTEGPKGPATSCKTEDIEKVCPTKDTSKMCKEKEERPTCPPNDPAQSCKSGDVQKICQSEEIRSFCQNDLHPISRDAINKTYTDQSPVVIGMDRCVKENTSDKSNVVCRTVDKNSCLPPEIEKELISDDCKDRKTIGPLKMKTACPPQQTNLTKGTVRRGDIRETAKPVGQISKEEANDSCYQRDQTCLEFAFNDAACETKVPCKREEVCQPAPPTPPCECPDCPEIAKLEYLNEPCHTDPDDILLPKEEVQKRRCFKCSTVQENTWIDLSATTGVPAEQLKERTAIIAKAFKNVMQQGTDNAKEWEVQWDTKERWQNPLLGWASSADPLGNVKLSFATQLDAERWCTRNGWKYVVLPEREAAPIPPKSYSDNFSWNRRYRVSTK